MTSNVGGGGQETVEDVLLVYSRHCPGAVEWAKYLHKLYTELSKHKGKLRVRHLPVEDLSDLSLLPPHMEKEITSSRLQLVLLSPTLLQFLARHSNLILGKLLHPDRVIAIMLGVRDSQITPYTRHHSLVSFGQWIHLEAKDHDLEFVQTVLYFSTQILQKPTSQQLTASAADNKRFHRLVRSASNLANNCRPPESTSFHVHPRRLSEDLSKVMVVFETPQSSRSKMRVTLERTEAGLQDIDLDELKLLNPYNMIVTFPSCCFSVSTMAALRLEIDGANRGVRTVRIESSLSQMDHLLKMTHDPIEFMCQAMGINPVCRDQLDEALTKQLIQNMPKNGFQLLNGLNSTHLIDVQSKDIAEFPTLLHFAACHGLSKLSAILTDCSGVFDAIQMRNASEMTPAELAHVNGHFDLANRLHSLHVSLYKESNKQNVYEYIQQNNYQIPPPPRPVHMKPQVNKADPYGTMRAEKKSPPLIEDAKENLELEQEEDDEVFVNTADKFGTLRANKAIHKSKPENRMDYRSAAALENQPASLSSTDELAITDEFLKLLEDFQSKNYSHKEMELLFENWKRKAELQDLKVDDDAKSDTSANKEKTKKQKATNLILKLFKSSNALMHSQSEPYIKATKDTKTYRRPSKTEEIQINVDSQQHPAPYPHFENETIIEGEITIINADDLEIISSSNNNRDKPKESPNEGISSQILPLSRLSLSSSNSSPPNAAAVDKHPKNLDQTPTGRPVAEVQPFSSDESPAAIARVRTSPVRDKLDKIRRSLTEPLMQYFHDLQSSPDGEEPEILNTPKSVVAPPLSSTESIITKAKTAKKSKTLFQEKVESESTNNRPPPMVTDM